MATAIRSLNLGAPVHGIATISTVEGVHERLRLLEDAPPAMIPPWLQPALYAGLLALVVASTSSLVTWWL